MTFDTPSSPSWTATVRPGCTVVALVALLGGWLLLAPTATASARPSVYVFPSPNTRFATPLTQISFRGVPRRALGRITVAGSRSGNHAGQLRADSDGRGASFYPDRPFVPGELVTVHTSLRILGGRGGTFTFRIDHPARLAPQGERVRVPRVPGDVLQFHSRPDLRPASVQITVPHASSADIFLAAMHGPLQWGPMIIDSHGSLVWFKPLSGKRTIAADVQVQQYHRHPVLTWWQGIQNDGNPAPNEDVIVDRRYQTIAVVRAGNGLRADLHEFRITPQNTALITAYRLVDVPGQHLPVVNCFVQEIDIPTGNVIFQWDSLDHVPVADEYGTPSPFATLNDYFHINSVDEDADGNLIVSARDTWAIYKIDRRTGRVLWELGGKHSSFKMGRGTRTTLQHDATVQPGGLITIFDNEDWPLTATATATPRPTRVIMERIDTRRHTATLVWQRLHTPSIFSWAEGSAQLLPGGQLFVGWGESPYFTEFDAGGQEIFDGRFVGENSSYRVFEERWNAQPLTRPAIALSPSPDGSGATTVYASWNGATEVSQWRVLAGQTPGALRQLAAAPRSGFETSIEVQSPERYFAVQAISASGRVLAQSRAESARPDSAVRG